MQQRRALVQRCQWHKRENVVSYVAKREQPVWRQRLQRAYNRPEYDEALTLHRLGVYGRAGPVAEDDERPRVYQRAH